MARGLGSTMPISLGDSSSATFTAGSAAASKQGRATTKPVKKAWNFMMLDLEARMMFVDGAAGVGRIQQVVVSEE